MLRSVAIEGGVFVVAGGIGTLEGWRLMSDASGDLYQMMAPGVYILALSLGMVLLGAAHLLLNRTTKTAAVVHDAGQRRPWRAIGIVALLCVNAILVQWLGYVLATLVFFAGAFKCMNVPSWRVAFVYAALTTAVFYLVFVRFCEVIFPAGALWS